jgi:hypothetical protein
MQGALGPILVMCGVRHAGNAQMVCIPVVVAHTGLSAGRRWLSAQFCKQQGSIACPVCMVVLRQLQ